ncbi:MAG: glycosyltransferase [Rudaea sp.]
MSSDLRVLHVHSSAGLYGAEYMMLGLVPALQSIGIDGQLLCLDNPHLEGAPLFDRAKALRVPARRIPCRGRFDLATVKALRDEMAAAPAIVHVHDYKSALHAWLARGRERTPVVTTLHGRTATSFMLKIYESIETRLMRRFESVCIVAEGMRRSLQEAGIRADRIHLIENGIDTDRFQPALEPWSRASLDLPVDAVVFGGVMRLSVEKNPLGMLEAFAAVAERMPRAFLVIAGDGPQRAALLDRAAELGLGARMRLAGARQDIEGFYPMLDVFVLPSITEGLPLALLEAMACARPVVATAVGQIPAVLAGLDAELVAPGDHDALARAMVSAAARSPTGGLRERAVARYSVSHMAQAYAQVYRAIGTGHGRAAA